MALDPANTRLLITASLIVLFIAIQIKSPRTAVLMMMVYLPFLGLIRRALIPIVGWNSLDTFIILVPVLVLAFTLTWLSRKYILREGIDNDTALFKMIRWMLAYQVLQVFNPLQGSLLVGFFGVVVYIVPILFMVISREYMNEQWMKRIFLLVFIVGLLVAAYGFKQYWFGYYPFEEQWREISGYVALKVYDTVRPISTFSSAAEYSYYLVMAMIVAYGYFLKGPKKFKPAAIGAVVFLFAALFVESSRTPIVTAVGALFVMTILCLTQTKHRILLFLVASLCLAGLFVGMSKVQSDSDLISHSVDGLTDPMGEDSTLPGHISLVWESIAQGFKLPYGHGLGSTSMASSKFGGLSIDSEIDISNQFLSTGAIGGILYFAIVMKVLIAGYRNVQSGNMVHLIILGLLVGLLFKWLHGGHYSVVPILWIAIGYLDRCSSIPIPSKKEGA